MTKKMELLPRIIAEKSVCELPVVEAIHEMDANRSTYSRTQAAETMHRFPRLGHGDDIRLLFEGDSSQQSDYLVGLLWFSLTIFLFFTVWVCVLFWFSHLGPKRVGFCSAKQEKLKKPSVPQALKKERQNRISYAKPKLDEKNSAQLGMTAVLAELKKASPANLLSAAKLRIDRRKQFSKMASASELKDKNNNDDEAKDASQQQERDSKIIQEYQEAMKKCEQDMETRERRLFRIRLGVGFCCGIIIMCSILFMVMSFAELKTFQQSFQSTVAQMKNVNSDSIRAAEDFQDRQSVAKDSSSKFMQDINSICPKLSSNLCSNVSSGTTECDFSPIPFGDHIQKLFYLLRGASFWIQQDDKVVDDLRYLDHVFEGVLYYYLDNFEWAFWVAAIANCGLAVLCIGILCLMILISTEKPLGYFKFVRSWFIVPLFAFLTLISWLMSLVFFAGSIISADVCYNSPNVTVSSILEALEKKFDSFIFSFLDFFANDCPSSKSQEMAEFMDRNLSIWIQFTMPAIQSLRNAILNQAGFESLCGKTPLSILAVIESLEINLCSASETLANFRGMLACKDWRYPFEDLTYTAICTELMEGITWAMATTMIIVMFAFIILTLRIGYYEVIEIEVSDVDTTICCSCCCDSKKFDDRKTVIHV